MKGKKGAKEKKDFLSLIRPALTLFIISAAVTSLLALTNNITERAIKEREEQKTDEACREVLPGAQSFEEVAEGISEGKDGSGNITGYVINVGEKGYGGEIRILVGITNEGTVSGVSVISHSETPGLGANAAKPSFLRQFVGVNKAELNGNIDALSGATVSSKAVTNAVNNALEKYNSFKLNKPD